jgi:diketogulonate reductase-like aldo/keto reductase
MSEVTLLSGHKMPRIAFGAFNISKSETKEVILKAIRAGYSHIDTAAAYQNEEEIGEALQELFNSGEKKREEIYITTKCFMTKYRNIREALRHSLQRLKVSYLDQYLLHWPFALEPDDTEPPQFSKKPDKFPLHLVWAQMEEVKREGLVRSIGVSNWTVATLNDMLGYATILPDTNQFEVNPYNKRTELINFCLENGIIPVAYRIVYRPEGDQIANCYKCILDDPIVIEISQKYQKSPAQVLQAWCLSRKCAIIVKTLNESRMRENLESENVSLEQEDIEKINSIPEQGEYLDSFKVFGINIFK